jgi:hypothetical protein
MHPYGLKFICGNLSVIDHAIKPDKQLLTVLKTISSNILRKKESGKKTTTFLFEKDEVGLIKKIYFSISGFGNKDKSHQVNKKIANTKDCLHELRSKSPEIQSLLAEDFDIDFAPYYEQPTKQQEPKYKELLSDYKIYSIRKDLFKRFLSTLTSAARSGAEFNPEVAEKFCLNPDHIIAVKEIKELLQKLNETDVYKEYKSRHAKHASNTSAEGQSNVHPSINKPLNPLEFIIKICWQCYMDDAQSKLALDKLKSSGFGECVFYDLSKKGSSLKDTQTSRPVQLTCKADINKFFNEKTNEKKSAYKAFSKLWLHMCNFEIKQLTDMMQHCAETNLIKWLNEQESKGNNIFKPPFSYEIVSFNGGHIMPICDICHLCSVNKLQKIYQRQTGMGDHVTTVGSLPVSNCSPSPHS